MTFFVEKSVNALGILVLAGACVGVLSNLVSQLNF